MTVLARERIIRSDGDIAVGEEVKGSANFKKALVDSGAAVDDGVNAVAKQPPKDPPKDPPKEGGAAGDAGGLGG